MARVCDYDWDTKSADDPRELKHLAIAIVSLVRVQHTVSRDSCYEHLGKAVSDMYRMLALEQDYVKVVKYESES